MAIYHLHSGFVSRSTGRSAVQSAAYISGKELHEDRRNIEASYHKEKNEVVLTKTLVPEHSKFKDISVWNEIENFEDKYAEQHFKTPETCENYKCSAQTAMTIVLALPNELSNKSNEELLDKFIDIRFTSRGLITTYAIHQKEGNTHAHLLVSRRAIDENGEFSSKKDRGICSKAALIETRKLWAGLANEFLEREGLKERITEKSFESLGINLEATNHRGWYADQLGNGSRIIQSNEEISRINEERILADPSIISDYLNEKKAVFTQKDILKEIQNRVSDVNKISAVFEKVLEESEYIGENSKGEFLYTGTKYRKLESDVISAFENLSSQDAKTHCEQSKINQVIQKYDYLSEEQKEAVRGLTNNENFGILIGKAGAGKTSTMRAVAEIYEKTGARVIGMSLSAVASENLGMDAKIESATIAKWAHQWRMYEDAKEKFLSFDSIVTEGVLKQFDWYKDLQMSEKFQLKEGDVIVVDEAGMVGAKEWNEILRTAEKFGAKVIAVGDDNQFKPISAGDCFRQFSEQSQTICELNEVRRQKEDWQREASVEFSKLNAGTALAMYENRGCIHKLTETREIAEKYLAIEELGTAAVLCSTRKECTAINSEVRELRRSSGKLGDDLVQIAGRNFATNDKVIFTENNKTFDVKNGQTGVVKSFDDGILNIETDSGLRKIKVSDYESIDHAYAITLHKSQGKTYDNTIVLANKIMDAKAAYVAMTRHRENVDLYYQASDFSDFKQLANGISKYSYKESLEDFRNIENQNKARVFEYKELQIEKALVLKEINNGEANWSEYNDLKKHSLQLGREILDNYAAHKLYLEQQGMTREKLEIQCGLKPRPLSMVEQNAKTTVELYAKTAIETKNLFSDMKKDVFNIKSHVDYQKYCEIRGLRNDLAREILANYPLHREFVNQVSKDFFISKKTLEDQVNYENRNNSDAFLKQIEQIKIPSDENSRNGFTLKSIDFIEQQQNDCIYKVTIGLHRETQGYGLYVNRLMLDNYLADKGLNIKPESHVYEYASMLVQNKLDGTKSAEASPELIESCIKRAVCFEALKGDHSESLNAKDIEVLHQKSELLASKLTDENIRVLNDTSLMTRANEVIKTDVISTPLSAEQFQKIEASIQRETSQNHKTPDLAKDMHREREFEMI